MADRTDYTKLLGERLERAYRAKDDIKPPSAEDIARWKRLAQAKRKEFSAFLASASISGRVAA